MLTLSPDRIVITNSTNGVVFDTNFGLFRSFDFVSGSVSLPARSGTSTPFAVTTANVDTQHVLSAINARCVDVFGMVQLVRTKAPSTPPSSVFGPSLWECVNGSVIDLMWYCGPLASDIPETQLIYPASFGFFTFMASGGQLLMRERLNIRAPQGVSRTWTDTRSATVVNYRLYCGSFV